MKKPKRYIGLLIVLILFLIIGHFWNSRMKLQEFKLDWENISFNQLRNEKECKQYFEKLVNKEIEDINITDSSITISFKEDEKEHYNRQISNVIVFSDDMVIVSYSQWINITNKVQEKETVGYSQSGATSKVRLAQRNMYTIGYQNKNSKLHPILKIDSAYYWEEFTNVNFLTDSESHQYDPPNEKMDNYSSCIDAGYDNEWIHSKMKQINKYYGIYLEEIK